VVNKPAGLLCVPGRGEEKQDCLIRRVQLEFPEALVVHRLDMATSGLLILARNQAAQASLSRQFQLRQVKKRYIAVVNGLLTQDSGEINLPLLADWPNRPLQKVDIDRGKSALTYFRVLYRNAHDNCSALELSPVTGRTHQLRVHMQSIGHPILGDRLYDDVDRASQFTRLYLHASELQITHPFSGECIDFCSAADFLN